MKKPDQSFVWAKSALEQAQLEKIGWKVAEGQRLTHHHAHGILLQWHGEGEPRLTAEKAA